MSETVHNPTLFIPAAGPTPTDWSWRNPPGQFRLVVFVASSGGIRALRTILSSLPRAFPPVLVAQHRSSCAAANLYADILGYGSQLSIKVAKEGDVLRDGIVYVAPADCHLELRENKTITVARQGKVKCVCPNADLLLTSVAATFGQDAIAVILTGSGRDGASGVTALRCRGGFVIAQDEESSEFFGMPGASIETGKADLVLGLRQIGFALCALVGTPDVPLRAGAN